MHIKKMIRDFLLKGKKLNIKMTDDDSLLLNGVIDSLKMIELTSYIEKTFDIEIQDNELMPDNFDTINAITNFIKSKIS